MTYIQGFLIPAFDKQDYRDLAAEVAPIFAEYGAQRIVQTWANDVPDGERTDLKRAVQAQPGETLVFSWIVWPDRASCDAASQQMQSDERMQPGDTPMPFDMQRMIYGGFETVEDTGETGTFGYVDGMAAPVPSSARHDYIAHARAASAIFRDLGATRLVENWGADVPEGKVTDFKRAVAATADETVVFAWIEWPDKPTRDKGMAAVSNDPRMAEVPMPFDGKRMIFGGFIPLFDTSA